MNSPSEQSLLTAEMRANFRHLYADVFWYGVVAGSVIAFVAIYAARLNAHSFELSLLTAGPAAVNLVFSLPAGRWLERRPLVRETFWSAALMRLGYLALIPLPWLFGERGQVWMIVLITLAMSIPGTLLAISFNALLADVVPPDRRAEVVGKRNALMAVSVTVTSLLCGQLLDRIIFPYNYQLVFALGVLGGILSTYHVGQVCLPGESPLRLGRPLGDWALPGLPRLAGPMRLAAGLRFLARARGKPLLRLDLLRGSFGLFLLACLLFYTFQYIPVPLFPLYYVDVMKLTDSALSLGTALFYVVMFFVSLRLSQLTARYGHRGILVGSALAFALFPLVLTTGRAPYIYWIACLIGGGVWGLLNAGLINRLMERVPDDDRPAYMALHNLALNLGILAGSLAGPALWSGFGPNPSMWIGAGLRFCAGLLLLAWG